MLKSNKKFWIILVTIIGLMLVVGIGQNSNFDLFKGNIFESGNLSQSFENIIIEPIGGEIDDIRVVNELGFVDKVDLGREIEEQDVPEDFMSQIRYLLNNLSFDVDQNQYDEAVLLAQEIEIEEKKKEATADEGEFIDTTEDDILVEQEKEQELDEEFEIVSDHNQNTPFDEKVFEETSPENSTDDRLFFQEANDAIMRLDQGQVAGDIRGINVDQIYYDSRKALKEYERSDLTTFMKKMRDKLFEAYVCKVNGKCARKFSGIIKDAYGIPIENTYVFISTNRHFFYTKSDAGGYYELWLPGAYDDRDLRGISYIHPYFTIRSYGSTSKANIPEPFAPCTDTFFNHESLGGELDSINMGSKDSINKNFSYKCNSKDKKNSKNWRWTKLNPIINITLASHKNKLIRSGRQVLRTNSSPWTKPGSIPFSLDVYECGKRMFRTKLIKPNKEGYFRQVLLFKSEEALLKDLAQTSHITFSYNQSNKDRYYISPLDQVYFFSKNNKGKTMPYDKNYIDAFCKQDKKQAVKDYLKYFKREGSHIMPQTGGDRVYQKGPYLISINDVNNSLKQINLSARFIKKAITGNELGRLGINGYTLDNKAIKAHPKLFLNSIYALYEVFVRPKYKYLYSQLKDKGILYFAYQVKDYCMHKEAGGCVMRGIGDNNIIINASNRYQLGRLIHETLHYLDVKQNMGGSGIKNLRNKVFLGRHKGNASNFLRQSLNPEFIDTYAQINDKEDIAKSAEIYWSLPVEWEIALGTDAKFLRSLKFSNINSNPPLLNKYIWRSGYTRRLATKFVFLKEYVFGGEFK